MTWIQTRSGMKVDLANPTSSSIHIDDIAYALSRAPRFTGHTKHFYSVAQHSVWCCDYVAARNGSSFEQMVALLHDASEAYTGDINRPLKRMLGDAIRDVELSLWNAIWVRLIDPSLRVPITLPAIVKIADEVALVTEAAQLLPHSPIDDWASHCEADPVLIVPLPRRKARRQFMNRYYSLRPQLS